MIFKIFFDLFIRCFHLEHSKFGITAMTGQQEHPGTGRHLDHSPAYKIDYKEVAKVAGFDNVYEVNQVKEPEEFKRLVKESLEKD